MLVNRSQAIVIENLNVMGMLKNRRLAKAIADVAWFRFRQFLYYKVVESQWCTLIQANRFYPSTQTCSHCTHRLEGDQKLTLSQRYWTCIACNTEHDRDENAALNLKQLGLEVIKYSDPIKIQGVIGIKCSLMAR